MGSMNKVILIGRLGKDSEVKFLPNGGDPMAKFSLATSETWMKDGERQEKTEWHNCVLFGKQAESLGQYLVKGKEIAVEGKLTTRKWEKDGQDHYATEVKVDRVTLLSGGPKDGESSARSSGSASRAPSREQKAAEVTDDDIPF
jgi:single-strand DNA-binding protein